MLEGEVTGLNPAGRVAREMARITLINIFAICFMFFQFKFCRVLFLTEGFLGTQQRDV